MTCLSATSAQEDSVKFQAILNNALPTIQAQMEILLESSKDYLLSPEYPTYIEQTANDSVIVADMIKKFPIYSPFYLFSGHFVRRKRQPSRKETKKGRVLQTAWRRQAKRSEKKVRSVLQNILDLFKKITASGTILSDDENDGAKIYQPRR